MVLRKLLTLLATNIYKSTSIRTPNVTSSNKLGTYLLYIWNCNSYESLFQRAIFLSIGLYPSTFDVNPLHGNILKMNFELCRYEIRLYLEREVLAWSGFGHGGSVDGRGAPPPALTSCMWRQNPPAPARAPSLTPSSYPGL